MRAKNRLLALILAATLTLPGLPAHAAGGGEADAEKPREESKVGREETSGEKAKGLPIDRCYGAPESPLAQEKEPAGDRSAAEAGSPDAAEDSRTAQASASAIEAAGDESAPRPQMTEHDPTLEQSDASTPVSNERASDAAAAPALAEQPYQLVRTLEVLQDEIAQGNRQASAYQRELISQIAKKLPLVTDEDWKKPKNTRAAIIYALSGGDPGVLAKLLSLSPLPCVDDTLIKGLLDYSQGRNQEAWVLLSKVDPFSLDPRMGGHLALAQAMLIANDDPKKAMEYLDMARVLSSGTLVEEAALRREAVIAAMSGDFAKFEMLTSQYLRRFSNSVYADDFIQRFAVAVTTSQYADNASLFGGLAETLDRLGSEQRLAAYLAIAEAGIVRGRVWLTKLSAQKLADFAKNDPKLAARAKLYEAAVLVVTDEFERGVEQLGTIERGNLPPRDQSLLDAALSLASRLRTPPAASNGDEPPPPPVSAEQGSDASVWEQSKIIDSARNAIVKADELLNGGRP